MYCLSLLIHLWSTQTLPGRLASRGNQKPYAWGRTMPRIHDLEGNSFRRGLSHEGGSLRDDRVHPCVDLSLYDPAFDGTTVQQLT